MTGICNLRVLAQAWRKAHKDNLSSTGYASKLLTDWYKVDIMSFALV